MLRSRLVGCVSLVAALTLTLALTACGKAEKAAESAKKDPIKVGAVSSLTGPFPFPEAAAGAKAVFDRVNADGGIAGRMIEYQVEDDKADPKVTPEAARRLVEAGVVANVGSSSLLECSVNAEYYEKNGLRSVQGVGVDPVCFNTRSISPVNAGAFTSTTVNPVLRVRGAQAGQGLRFPLQCGLRSGNQGRCRPLDGDHRQEVGAA